MPLHFIVFLGKPSISGIFYFMGLNKDITGQRFGRLIAIERNGKEKQGQQRWRCRCDCGGETTTAGRNLRNGHTVSCGCYALESSIRHGHNRPNKRTAEYTTWHSMIQRCCNEKSKAYQSYGKKGITVCEEWRDFINFYRDMGDRPSLKHSLDRFPDMNGNYEKSNCRWGTTGEQARNKNNNRWIEYDGQRMIAADWSIKTGIRGQTIVKRISQGFHPKDALRDMSISEIRRIKKLIKENKYNV